MTGKPAAKPTPHHGSILEFAEEHWQKSTKLNDILDIEVPWSEEIEEGLTYYAEQCLLEAPNLRPRAKHKMAELDLLIRKSKNA